MCRADLPMPIHAQEVRHVIVPVPVWPQPPPAPQWKKFALNCIFMAAIAGVIVSQYF
jgi:hypothetical protein